MSDDDKPQDDTEDDEPPRGRASKPVSFHPLEFEEALEAILSVDPRKDSEPASGEPGS